MRHDQYKWVIVAIGLINAPGIFMHTINTLFKDILNSVIVVFLDDILMYYNIVGKHCILL